MRYILICAISTLFLSACKTSKDTAQTKQKPMESALLTGFEKNDNTTATYFESIAFYKALGASSSRVTVNEFGMTDSGYPLHEIVISNDGESSPKKARQNGKAILFINNAIHPGEPCGVDASMMLARDLVMNDNMANLLQKTTVVIIPIYNISGSLNRGSYSRANQQGPEAYGFRGNGQNLDLNRDFIKSDSDNAKSFNKLYTKWSPDVFIDNHTSNGADYQYVMTLIATQKDKMEAPLSTYMSNVMLPELYQKMERKGYEMTPYVYARTTPDKGIAGFLDLPRYSSGYASLHNSISFMPETHMLKPYKDRVKSTYLFMESMLEHLDKNHAALLAARETAINTTKSKKEHDLHWTVDREQAETTLFKGYEAAYKPSEVSGIDRLYYDQNQPYEQEVPFYNTYAPTLTVDKPKAYIIPRPYKQIVDKMEANGVQVMRLNKDEVKEVEIYHILDFKTVDMPYEGHYLHSKLDVEKRQERIQYLRGDYVIQTGQAMDNYIVQTLEPQAPDSWFSWNFFDGILMQKEHFSSYVFEDIAAAMLKKDPMLKAALDAKKEENEDFAQSAYQQLDFIYQQSPHYEPTYRRYPVGRILK